MNLGEGIGLTLDLFSRMMGQPLSWRLPSESQNSTKQTRLPVPRNLTFPAVSQERAQHWLVQDGEEGASTGNKNPALSFSSEETLLTTSSKYLHIAGWSQDCDMKPWN